jgi:hypothetical protein
MFEILRLHNSESLDCSCLGCDTVESWKVQTLMSQGKLSNYYVHHQGRSGAKCSSGTLVNPCRYTTSRLRRQQPVLTLFFVKMYVRYWLTLWTRYLSQYGVRLWAGGPGDRGSIPGRGENFSCSLFVQIGSGTHPTSCTMGTEGPFPGGKAQPGRDTDHSPPSSAEVENEWELYFLSPYAFVACSGTALALLINSDGRLACWYEYSESHLIWTQSCKIYFIRMK